MRFKCAGCGESMDSSLVNDDRLRAYKRKEIGVDGIPCPFCRRNALEVES